MAMKVKVAQAVGPLRNMAEVVAFYATVCDLMTATWVEVHEVEMRGDQGLRVHILRGLCTRELQEVFRVMQSQDPKTAAGL